MKIALGSDHRGYAAKERIKTFLESCGHQVTDFGCEGSESCDYPDAAIPAAQSVAEGSRIAVCCAAGQASECPSQPTRSVEFGLRCVTTT